MRVVITAMAIIALFLVADVAAKGKAKKQDEAKTLSGISITGNKEAPKSLFIVPWKSSELGGESDLASNLLNEKMETVDKDVFERELDFYSLTATE
jgi:hypothetical protein